MFTLSPEKMNNSLQVDSFANYSIDKELNGTTHHLTTTVLYDTDTDFIKGISTSNSSHATDSLPFYGDYSHFDYPGSIRSPPSWESSLKIMLYASIIIASIIGNTLVILVVIRNKRLQTTTNYYIVNLAISDLLITVFCSWVNLVDDLTEGWVLGAFLCKFDSFAQVTAVISSTLSLSLIACDRFFGIVFAMKAHIIERRASYSIALIWLCSIAVGTPLLFTRSLEQFQWKNHLEIFCKDEWPADDWIDPNTESLQRKYSSRVAYWTIVTVLLYFLPVLIMAAVYILIMKTLLTTRAPGEMVGAEINVQAKMKKKVVVMLALILAVFALCWFPLQACILYVEYRPDQNMTLGDWYYKVSFFSYALAYSNSALNPIIYTGFNQNFRKGFRSLFRCYEKTHYTNVSRVDSFHSSTIVTKV